ncbi:hypothetical protein GCM10010493_26110 [Streptomyces lavendulae subsp. grasserius]
MQRAPPVGGEGGDGRRIGEVEAGDAQVPVAGRRGDVLGHALARGHVADGQGDGRSGPGEDAGRSPAEAGGGAGDDRAAAGEVDAPSDVGGGAGEAVGCGDGGHG